MSNRNHSWNGQPLTGTISGFSKYSTIESADKNSSPVHIITPKDVLDKIESIRRFLDIPELENALKVLNAHLHDFGNPHRTSLNDFLEQIIDVLYAEYVRQGGTKDKAGYTEDLFKVLHVADAEEMKTGTDESALLSVAGVRELIHAHEVDEEAHKELLDGMFPGRPVVDEPIFCIDSEIGVPPTLTVRKNVVSDLARAAYTYIGIDGNVYLADSFDKLPVDRMYGVPLIPIFGARTNYIPNSDDFSGYIHQNITLTKNYPDLMKNTNATTISASDTVAREHSIIIPDVELTANEYKTFSIFAKAGDAKYVMLSYTDFLSKLVVRAIFDLTTGEKLIINPLTRYSCDIATLKDGWSRCSITLYSNLDQVDDLAITFFDEKDPNLQDFTYISTGVVGYVWGVQLENGNNMSPYIPTSGQPALREGIYLKKQLTDKLGTSKNIVVSAGFKTVTNCIGTDRRPIFVTKTIENDTELLASEANFGPTGYIDTTRWASIPGDPTNFRSLMDLYPFSSQDKEYGSITVSVSENKIVNAYNTTTYEMDAPAIYDLGDILYLGSNGAEFYEGYLRNVVVYQCEITKDQAIFLNGETIYEY